MAKLQPRPSANCLGLGLGMGMGLGRRRGTHGSCEMKVDATMPVMRCDAMGWDVLPCQLAALETEPEPRSACWHLQFGAPARHSRSANVPQSPLWWCRFQLEACRCDVTMRCDAMRCQVLPLELIMLALSDTLLTSALTFCGFFPFCGKNYLLYPSYMHGMKGEFHWSK